MINNEKSFSKNRPYGTVILLAILCTFLTALGSAIPQILKIGRPHNYIIMTTAVVISAGIALLIMKASRFTLLEFGIRRDAENSIKDVWFYIPLIIVEIIPIVVYGFSTDITATLYIVLALFTIGIGFNEELYFRGLILKFIKEKGTKQAIIWSSVIFGILHIANAFSATNFVYIVIQIAFAFLVGIVLAEIVTITKSVWIVIIWHTLHDYISYITEDTMDVTALIILVIQVIIFVVYAVGLWRKSIQSTATENEIS